MLTLSPLYVVVAHIAELMPQRQWQLTTAESCTGGGVAYAITTMPGSSAWFEQSFVTYSNQSKTQLLNVQPTVIEDYGAVSEPVVRAMARGALQVSAADIATAISGIAGPEGGTAAKPVGTVWIAWATQQQTWSQCYSLSGNRQQVRESAIMASLKGVLAILEGIM